MGTATISPMCGRHASFLPACVIVRSLVPRIIRYGLISALFWSTAQAAELDGMQLPDTLQVDGKTLHLNGLGLRTYSFLRIHIYVAGLYLEHLSTDPNEIIASPETKLLDIRFEHNISARDARKAWRQGLKNNCTDPCRLEPEDVARFLAGVPAIHAGDDYSMVFARNGATVTANGHQIGMISRPVVSQFVV